VFEVSAKPGALVAYAHRAGRVMGIVVKGVAGRCLAVEHTAAPKAVVFIPWHRVAESVTPISEAQACELDKHVHALTFGELRMRRHRGKLSPERRRILAAAGAKGMASRWKTGART